VYVVDRSGGETGTELRPIELGPSYGGFTVISTGLDVGHEVITTGQTMVAEGDLLEISSNNAQ
jgi:multidrug efflux pump subunit AcrA (membrane-fusion protein)